MKLNIIILGLFSIVCNITNAQQKNIFSVSFGFAAPVGGYAQKDSNSFVASGKFGDTLTGKGLAQTGINLSVSYQYDLNKHFGLMTQLRGQQNSVDANFIRSQLINDNTGTDEAIVKAQKWVSGSILAGAFYRMPLCSKTHKLEMQLKLMGGTLKTSIPERSYALFSQQNNLSSLQSAATISAQSLKWAFTYQAGAGLLYNLTKRIILHGDLDYANALLHSNYRHIVMINNGYELGNLYTVHSGMSTISLSIGAGIRF
jgi:opacity protein-like surface antigen